MGFFNEFPHTRTYDKDLGWLIATVKELQLNLNDFIKINTVKYADPIIWNITTQYEANTIVVDGNTGTAYISVQPVPSGVALTNTDYWTPIFTLNLLSANQNITFRDDSTNVVATFASDTGDWLLWNFYLYRVTQPISVNTAYLEGFNLERFSVELFIKDYIDTLAGIIGDLDDLDTSDKTSIVDAINSLKTDINTIIGDLDDLNTSDKTSIVNAINETLAEANNKIFVTPEMFGAVGDGLTDDTAAIQATLNSGKNVIFDNEYLVVPDSLSSWHHTLDVPDNIIIDGHGSVILSANNYGNYDIFHIKERSNVTIKNINIVGDADIHTGSAGEWGFGICIDDSHNVLIDNVKVSDCWGDGIYISHLDVGETQRQKNDHIVVNNCILSHNGRNNISIVDGQNIIISKCYLTDAYRTAPKAGIDIEPDATTNVYNIIVDNCIFENNGSSGLNIVHITNSDAEKIVVSNNVFYEKIALMGFSNASGNAIKDLITGNKINASDRIFESDSYYSAVFVNNLCANTAQSANIPFKMAGPAATVENNTFTKINTTSAAMIITGPFSAVSGNTFKEVTCSDHMIECGEDFQFTGNIIDIMNPNVSYILYATSLSNVHADHNVVTGRSASPVHFIGPSTTPVSNEVIAFNDITVIPGSTISNISGIGAHSNIVNGTFVA